MLDENEFKPFNLTDFPVADVKSEKSESFSAPAKKLATSFDSTDEKGSDRIESFMPLTFEEEEVSEDFISKKSNDFQEMKTNAEKIQLSEEFKNSEFFMENSLLTNAEEFAETIREGAKLHKAQLLEHIEQQANDTDRIHQKTVAENQEASKQREQLLSETKNEVQQIKDEAYKEGFEAGRLQGIQLRYDEAKPLTEQANKILEQLNSLRKVVRFQAEEELVNLALEISKNIVAEEIKLNQDVIKNIVNLALQETEVQGKIYLYLNTEDYKFLIESKAELDSYLSEEQNLVIRQNSEMKPGSIRVESDEEIISRSIEKQFHLIEENLNEQIENRQAHLNEVDIDAHDFNLPSNQDSQTAKIESLDFTNLNTSDESLIHEKKERKTNQDEFVETKNKGDDFNKEDSVLEDEVLKPLKDSDNVSLERTDTIEKTTDTKTQDQNLAQVETKTVEENKESTLPTDKMIDVESEEPEKTSTQSLE